MTNRYLEKVAGFSLGGIGKSIRKTVGVLKGDNILKAKKTQLRAADATYEHSVNYSHRLNEHMGNLDEHESKELWNKANPSDPVDLTDITAKLNSSQRSYDSGRKAYGKINRLKKGTGVAKENERTKKYRIIAGTGTAAVGVAGIGTAVYKNHEKKAENMTNKYLEKIAGIPGLKLGTIGKGAVAGAAIGGVGGAALAGKDNRIKGALAGATAGGIAGSVFGRASLAAKNKNVFNAGPGPGANAKLINPKAIG